jgi:hypothetical protein
MKNFAVIENGLVKNVVIAEDKLSAEETTSLLCVEYSLDSENVPHIGLAYNSNTGIFEQPVVEELAIPEKPSE